MKMKIHNKNKNIFKKIFISCILCLLIILLIILFFKYLKPTTINGTKLMGEITTEIIFEEQTSEFINKNEDNILPKVYMKYYDRYDNTTLCDIKTSDIKYNIIETDISEISENKLIINKSYLSGNTIHLTASYNSEQKEYTYIVKYNTSKEIKENSVVKNPDDIDVLVNKKRHLSSNYKPSDLVEPNVRSRKSVGADSRKMRKEAANKLEELFNDAQKDNCILYTISGYRSYSTQNSIFSYNVKAKGSEEKANKTSAKPGESEHQTGLAMDVSSKSANYSLTQKFGETKEGKWLKNNAYKYGFIIRYPKNKENITGYSYEPWHIRYVGKALAEEIHKRNITLEEFYELK